MSEFKITERGWAGHFICSNRCNFRRNTLVEYQYKKIVVSTVGLLEMEDSTFVNRKYEKLGVERYYETVCYEADYNDSFLDINIDKPIYLEDVKSHIDRLDAELEANEMHENTVKEIQKYLLKGDYNE